MPPLTDKHSFKLCSAVKGCIPLGDHHRRQPWLRGYPTSENCCMCALYGAVITECCLWRGLGSPSPSRGDPGEATKGPVDGAATFGDADPVEPCWGSRCLRNENDELKFNKCLYARQRHLKRELLPFD